MKAITLSLLLVCSILTVSAKIVCNDDDTLLPNPEDCNTFYVCDNGVPKLTSCPPTLHFNPEALVCDRPENVNCQVGSTVKPTTEKPVDPSTEGPTTDGTSTEGTTTEEQSTEGTSTEGPTTEGPTVSTPPSTTQCPPTGSHLLPNPSDCSSFIVCIDGRNTTISCPNGMLYNEIIKTCDSPQNVNCNGSQEPTTEVPETTTSQGTTEVETTTVPSTSTTNEGTYTWSTTEEITTTNVPSTWPPTEGTTPPSTGCPSSGSAIIPNPNDCASFFVCIDGRHIIVPCPSGMLYNNDIKTCDKPQNVNCNIDTSSAAPETTTQSETSTATEETTGEYTTEGTSLGTEDPTSGTTLSDITTENPANPTTEQPGYRPDCPEEGYAVMENPDSCSSFYVCVNGNFGLVQCPAGSNFNPLTVKCDLPENPQCHVGTTEVPPTVPPYVPTCPENGTTLLPDPSSCSSFYICINGNYAQLSCPEDFEFNVTTQSCLHSQHSSCSIINTHKLEFECEKDGSFPNPEDCSKYYVCVGDQVFPMECPGGLHFDISLSTCNTPDQAQCSTDSTEQPPSTEQPTSTEKTTTGEPPTPNDTTTEEASTTKKPTTVKPTTGRPGNEPDCPAVGTDILPNPDDCTQFFICIEGSFDVVDCPEGYAFNEKLDRCDLAENVNCNAGTTPSPSHPDCPSEGSAKLPNPDDCGSYIYCLNGQFAIIDCPDGLNYDSNKKECSATATCFLDSTTQQVSTSTTKKPTTTDEPTASGGTDEPTTPDDSSTSSPGECTADGELLPNPNDCESFFLCANGIPVKIECPPGLEFNADALVCDNPSTANCSTKVGSQTLLKFLKFWN